MKVVLFANTDWYLYNFRRSLITALRDRGDEVVLISPPGPYGERLRALGVRWEPIPMDRRSLNPFRELNLLAKLWRIFRKEKPKIVHSFTIKCAVYGSIAARCAAVPGRVNAIAGMGYVFTSGDLTAWLLRPIVRGLIRLALGGAHTRTILQNPDDLGALASSGSLPPGTARLIPGSGVDCTRFSARAKPREQCRAPRVLLPARLLWDKGVAEYISAARQVRGAGRQVRFLIAGEPDAGNPASVPPDLVRDWVSEGVVEWLGHVEDMPTLFSSVDIVVLPSYREGLPKGLIEAAASGLALITTNVPGCREVVTHEVDGLLVPVRDANALAAAIERLLEDPDQAAAFGKAAREKAIARFDEAIIVGSTLAVYDELIIAS